MEARPVAISTVRNQSLKIIPLSIYRRPERQIPRVVAQATETLPMRVMQLAKRSVTLLATVCVALTGCGDSGPDVAFNPAGTSADIQAVNATFASPTFGSFSSLSPLFDAALGGAPLVSASAKAFDFRRATTGGELRAAAVRGAKRVAALTPALANGAFSGSSAAIPAEFAGKTFEYSGGSYVAGVRTGAPDNGVRFLLYAINPVTLLPVEPLVEVGYVEITDLSSGSTQAARVLVVSGDDVYLNYTVAVTATAAGGQVTVNGFVTDGTTQANINLRSTLTQAAGLTLVYTLEVPARDVSINLTMTAAGLDPQTGTIAIALSMSGPNGSISMTGEFTSAGGTLIVRTNGTTFATITSSGAGEPVITGADGAPLADEDVEALGSIFEITGEAFTAFDAMVVPVGVFLAPAA
jgi:predicted small lipoprotein YifL